jgi:crotonobetainyl-CoA:carnitine CoA-transferase CaiB-like acyl-CoA transferase
MQSTPPPLLGQHTEEICRDLLKMPVKEIQRLVKEDILHTPANTQGTGKSMFG